MIKQLTTMEQFEEMYRLSNYAFLGGVETSTEHKESFLKKCEITDNYGVYKDMQLTSQVISHPFQVNVFGQPMSMGGIADVSTYPEFRGRGDIRKIFTQVFEDFYKNKTVLSYLGPFSQDFYRKFDYATTFEKKTVTVSNDELAKVPAEKSGSLKRSTWQDKPFMDTVKQLYQTTLQEEHGCLIREDWWWAFLAEQFKNRKLVIAFDDKNQPQGYLIYELNGKESKFLVHEMAYQNNWAQKKLLTFVASHDSSFKTFHFNSAANNQWYFLLNEPGYVAQNIQGDMMVRIMLIQSFIELYPFAQNTHEHQFIFHVNDPSAKWNDGYWKLIIQEGRALCQSIEHTDTVDIQIDIQSLTQWFFGVLDSDTLVFHEKVHGSANIINAFDSLLPKQTPHLYDYF